MLSVPTHDQIAAIDRSLPLYLIVEDRTKTVKIGVQCEPDTDDGKHFRVVVVSATSDAPDQDVSDRVVKIPNSTRDTFQVSRDLFDRMKRGPADLSIVLCIESEHDYDEGRRGLVGRGLLPKVNRFSDGGYNSEELGWYVGVKWDDICTEAGHQSPLGCGWVAKDKPCSKEEQYELREKAALNLAIGALATKKLSMMEMMQAVDGVPKELRRGLAVYGQGITGMYRAIAEWIGTDEFEPWTRLEWQYDQHVPWSKKGTKRMRAASD